LLFKAVV